jgi:hypothetical protein
VDDAVELADVIWQLRHELSRAMWAGENADLRFEAEKVELELTVGVERRRQGDGKVRFLVFEVGGGAGTTSTTTQRLTLTLKPVLAAAPERSALISGADLPGEE